MPQRTESCRDSEGLYQVGPATPTGTHSNGTTPLALSSLAADRNGLESESRHRCDRANFPQRNSVILSVAGAVAPRNDTTALANRVTQQGGHC